MSRRSLVEARNVEMTFALSRAARRHSRSHCVLRERRRFDVERGRDARAGRRVRAPANRRSGRMLVGLHDADRRHAVKLFGRARSPGRSARANLAAVRQRAQFVFQDPHAALNPRMRVGNSIAEPIDVAGAHTRRDRNDRVARAARPGRPAARRRRPLSARVLRRPAPAHRHRARAGARAGVHRLRRAGVGARRLDAGADRQPADGSAGRASASAICSSRTISRSCARVSHRVAVMYAGAIVELAPKRRALRNAAASLYAGAARRRCRGPIRRAAPRSRPSAARCRACCRPPPGCRFHTRCPHAMPRCRSRRAALRETAPGRLTACHLYGPRLTPLLARHEASIDVRYANCSSCPPSRPPR